MFVSILILKLSCEFYNLLRALVSSTKSGALCDSGLSLTKLHIYVATYIVGLLLYERTYVLWSVQDTK